MKNETRSSIRASARAEKVREAMEFITAADTRLLAGILGKYSCTPTTPEEVLNRKEKVILCIRAYLSIEMSDVEREIGWKYFFGGEQQAEVARDLGMDRKRVNGIVRKLRIKVARRAMPLMRAK